MRPIPADTPALSTTVLTTADLRRAEVYLQRPPLLPLGRGLEDGILTLQQQAARRCALLS
jgi:hypothetical protein